MQEKIEILLKERGICRQEAPTYIMTFNNITVNFSGDYMIINVINPKPEEEYDMYHVYPLADVIKYKITKINENNNN